MAQYLLEISEKLARQMMERDIEGKATEITEVQGAREFLPDCVKNEVWIKDIDGTEFGVDVFFDCETKRFLLGFTGDQFKRLAKRNQTLHTTFGLVVI